MTLHVVNWVCLKIAVVVSFPDRQSHFGAKFTILRHIHFDENPAAGRIPSFFQVRKQLVDFAPDLAEFLACLRRAGVKASK
jgi:hypothetical protein